MILQWLGRLLGWLVRRIGGMQVLLFSLLWCTLTLAGVGLSVVVTGLQVGLVMGVVFTGLLAGWLLARTRLPGWGFGLLGTVLGTLILVLTLGRIGHVVFDLQRSIFPVLGHLVQRHELVFTPLVSAWQALGDALAGLFFRFQNWFRALDSNEPINDFLVTSLLWGFLLLVGFPLGGLVVETPPVCHARSSPTWQRPCFTAPITTKPMT